MPNSLFLIDSIISTNRLLGFLHKQITKNKGFDKALMDSIKGYTNDYILNNAQGKPADIYGDFTQAYHKDMVKFAETALYPLEIDAHTAIPSRYEYNIILLFSCLFAKHRFRIMQIITEKTKKADNGLFIGCGPGLELELVKSRIDNIYAYDLSIDGFLMQKHPDIHFKEEYFTSKNHTQGYDAIFLIELLEHLASPYDLLEQCKDVLTVGGSIYLTTATNIPQFDHLYNFEPAHEDFERRVKQLGLHIDFMEDIPHQAFTLNIGAKNRFYILTKR